MLIVERKQPLVVTNTLNMTREDWLQHRKIGFGGSDIAAIFGFDKYKSPMDVYLDKIGEHPEDDEAGEAAYWGIVMEDTVAKEFEKRYLKETGEEIKVQRRNAMFQHQDHPYLIANIDRRIVGQNKGLECKTASEYLKDEWVGDDIPDKYMLQVQHYMGVMNYDSMYIAVLIGGNKFQWKEIPRNDEMIAMIAARAKDFWTLIENRTPPAVDGSQASSDVLKALYPHSRDNVGTQLDDSALSLVHDAEYWAIKEKEAADLKNEARNKLKQMIGECEYGFLSNGWKISLKSNSEFDEERFAQDYPDAYQQCLTKLDKDAAKKILGGKGYREYTKPSTTRPFKIVKPKEA